MLLTVLGITGLYVFGATSFSVYSFPGAGTICPVVGSCTKALAVVLEGIEGAVEAGTKDTPPFLSPGPFPPVTAPASLEEDEPNGAVRGLPCEEAAAALATTASRDPRVV